MKTVGTTTIISLEEAKGKILDHLADTLPKEPVRFREMLGNGDFATHDWNPRMWSDGDVAFRLSKIPSVGEEYAKTFGTRLLLMEMRNNFYQEIWRAKEEKKVEPENTIVVNHCGGHRDLRFSVQESGTVRVEMNDNFAFDGDEKKYEWSLIGTYPDTGTAIREVLRQECGW